MIYPRNATRCGRRERVSVGDSVRAPTLSCAGRWCSARRWGKTEQHMSPERTLGNRWMVEIICGIASHVQALHDLLRGFVDGRRERDDLFNAQFIETELDRPAGGLGCVSVAPRATHEAPADLDSRREVGIKACLVEADQTDEARLIDYLHRPQAPALAIDPRLNHFNECVALVRGQRSWKVPHYLRIGIERRERLAITLTPVPEQQAWRSELFHEPIITSRSERLSRPD